MKNRLNVPVELGHGILQVIEDANGGVECHLVMMVFPVEENGKLGQPSFLSSLAPDQMEDVIVQIAGGFAVIDKSKRIIDGIQ